MVEKKSEDIFSGSAYRSCDLEGAKAASHAGSQSWRYVTVTQLLPVFWRHEEVLENSWGLVPWKFRKSYWWMWSHSWSRSPRIEGVIKKSWGLSPCGRGGVLEDRSREAICEGSAQLQWPSQRFGDSSIRGQLPSSAPALERTRNAVMPKTEMWDCCGSPWELRGSRGGPRSLTLSFILLGFCLLPFECNCSLVLPLWVRKHITFIVQEPTVKTPWNFKEIGIWITWDS